MKTRIALICLGLLALFISFSFTVPHCSSSDLTLTKDSLRIIFEDFLKQHQPTYSSSRLEDLLVKKYNATSMEKLVDEYQHKLPFYPDEMYCLLLEHFEPVPELDSFYVDEIRVIMSYSHKFKNGVEFQYTELESGAEIWCLFPTQDAEQVRSFIVNLYNNFDKHAWDSDTTFAPVEYDVGCFGNLKVNENAIELSMYCGC